MMKRTEEQGGMIPIGDGRSRPILQPAATAERRDRAPRPSAMQSPSPDRTRLAGSGTSDGARVVPWIAPGVPEFVSNPAAW